MSSGNGTAVSFTSTLLAILWALLPSFSSFQCPGTENVHDNQYSATALAFSTEHKVQDERGSIDLEESRAHLWALFLEQADLEQFEISKLCAVADIRISKEGGSR
jgi:hypothetical protein